MDPKTEKTPEKSTTKSREFKGGETRDKNK